MKQGIDLTDINRKKGLPRTYRFSPFTRWATIIIGLFAIIWAVWYVFAAVDADTSTFKKIIPFIVIFLAGNSLIRNLFSLNTLTFSEKGLEFGYLLARNVLINWDEIKKLSVYSGKTRAVVMDYEKQGQNKSLTFTMVFPNMLEIINSIAEMCPDIAYDDFMKNIILTKTD